MWELLKKGNKSSGIAALGNLGLTIIKGIAAAISGSGSMFATTIHSSADTLNQGMVYFGSILAQKEPTKRFPTGFGRVINLFVLLAVIVISIMAYETLHKGWEIIQHPEESSNFWLNVVVLSASVIVDGYVLAKVMKEVVEESRAENSEEGFIKTVIQNVKYSAPPTRLVFYEDIVATLGALVALIAVIVAYFTGNYIVDGIGTMIIGVLLIGIAIKIGYENTIGLIGVAAPERVKDRVAKIILDHPKVVDISQIRVLQEGRQYHVESYIELVKGLSLAEADDIKFKVSESLLEDPDIDDATIGIIESDDEKNYKPNQKNGEE
ncbi:cation diffusion facilitator family transporter [Tenuibacillus multivorans]|uniref:Cation diffusion facilitator family transporter n=1 Tax=Tenuibacillus multivorans TaxID=237069 RepID=A0A1H0DCL2_9BACI|nr:cation diffusion facilitator family transporter [Tenuibacillus multivorans]GEL76613.1 cation diffusion facilitator transporter [Tenuibacillus multivorans]SDN67716.1 cation diffusion facilitator family transporter [Tenuibacillus multivorans]